MAFDHQHLSDLTHGHTRGIVALITIGWQVNVKKKIKIERFQFATS